MENAGIRVVAAVDCDSHAAAVYKHNFSGGKFLQKDLREFSPAKMRAAIGCDTVDVIFGGPPCQGFSRVRGGNHGAHIVRDERRELYRPFLDYVAAFQPKIFVMENVPGIQTAVNGDIFRAIRQQAENHGYAVHTELLRAWRFGVPQKRLRKIIVGFRKDIPPFIGNGWVQPTHADITGKTGGLKKPITLWEAIGDLPLLKAGQSANRYNLQRRNNFTAGHGDCYLAGVAKVDKSEALTGHIARPHMARDLRDFARLREGENSATALNRGIKMEFPYDRDKFKDRYTRQHRNRLSSTILAHLSKDGLMYIHPTQLRSLTPREAARIQSFPDHFDFPIPRTHQFRLIGNAVPPLMGRAIARAVKKHLQSAGKKPQSREPLFAVAA